MKKTVADQVKAFYDEAAFNYDSVDSRARKIRSINELKCYGSLDQVLSNTDIDHCVFDIGCGVGWFSNSVAYHYGIAVKALDLSEKVLAYARRISELLDVSAKISYQSGDLFDAAYLTEATLVNALGVLHHTEDAQAAFSKITSWIKPGGYVHVGLYHAYGRKPFLERFKKDAALRTEQEAFLLYKKLNPKVKSEKFLRSWFRDQVLHPHETTHTCREVAQWCADNGCRIQETSINKYQKIRSWDALFEDEKKLEQVSYQKNLCEETYYPGFFTVLAQKMER